MVTNLPRMLPGASPSSRAWDVSCTETELLGMSLRMRRTRTAEAVEGAAAGSTDLVIPWDYGVATHDGMMPFGVGPMVQIIEDATYRMLLQVRFAAMVPSGGTLGGSATGRRWARIMVGSTSAPSNSIAERDRPGMVAGLGTTVQVTATRPLSEGDSIWCGFRHTSSTLITSLNSDGGGTFFAIRRVGPGGR